MPNIFIDRAPSRCMRGFLLVFAVSLLLLASPVAFAFQSSGAEQFNPSNIVYQIFSYLIFGSVNMRSQAKDYVDVWFALKDNMEVSNDYFLTAYVLQYRIARSSVSPTGMPISVNSSILARVDSASRTNTFLGRLILFFRGAPDDSKARVLVNLLLSLLLSFGICFLICLPLPPGMMSLKSSGIEAFLVAIISTFFLTWFGVTSKFLSLVFIVVLCVLMAILYSVVFAKHSFSNMYGDKSQSYAYPPSPVERRWW